MIRKRSLFAYMLSCILLLAIACQKEASEEFPVPAPTITAFTPASGPIGTVVTISGKNFGINTASNIVKVNGVTAQVLSASSTELTIAVPAGATTGTITVTVNGQTVMSPTDFTVTGGGGPAPTITSFTPATGAVGTTVTITGTNFSTTPANNTIKINGVTATVTAATATQLTITVPTGATTGAISITVNGQTATSVTNFTVTGVVVPAPTITSFTPASGAAGATVTITGTNFSTTPANNTVKINGVTATVTAATATQLTITVPAGSTTGAITVTVNGQTATSATNFTVTGVVVPAPTITSFTPTSGAASASVTITGTNFSTTPANNTVKINGVTATVTAATATQLTITVPAGATTGAITVTVNGQTATSISNFTVTGVVTPAPTITSFTPTTGTAGVTLVINGTNFSTTPGNNIVKVNGVTATVTASSSTQIGTTVPTGATTGFITVTVNGQTATSNTVFTVQTPVQPLLQVVNFAQWNGTNMVVVPFATAQEFMNLQKTFRFVGWFEPVTPRFYLRAIYETGGVIKEHFWVENGAGSVVEARVDPNDKTLLYMDGSDFPHVEVTRNLNGQSFMINPGESWYIQMSYDNVNWGVKKYVFFN